MHDISDRLSAWSEALEKTTAPAELASVVADARNARQERRTFSLLSGALLTFVLIIGIVWLNGRGTPVEPQTAPPTPTDPATSHMTSPSEPPAADSTISPSNTVSPTASTPGDGSQYPELTLSRTNVSHGDQIQVRITCPRPADPWGEAYLQDPTTSLQLGEIYRIPPASEDPPSDIAVYEGSIAVPYWLAPGRYEVGAACPDPMGTRAVGFDLTKPKDPWDLWRPTVRPSFELDSGDGPQRPDFWVAHDGGKARVTAVCHPGITPGGARFILWGTYNEIASSRSHPFFAVEYPVTTADYAPTAQGVQISAIISIDSSELPPPTALTSDPTITALCTPTTTPFAPEGEPPIEDAEVALAFDW